jgi:hypothetical protein
VSYADSLLTPGERLLRRGRRHWLTVLRRSGWALVALAVAIGILYVRATVSGSSPVLGMLGYVTLALVLFGVASIGWTLFGYLGEEVVLTSRRVLRTGGVVNKHSADASLDQVTDAVLSESFLGRLFGYGDLRVLTASAAGVGRLRMLRDAKGFQKALLEARHELGLELARPTMPALRMTGTPPAPAAPQPPAPPQPALTHDQVVAELHRLAERYAAGQIEQADFDRRRGELLARL